MIVGVPKEIKNNEYRVGLTPPSVRELTQRGHQVLVQKNAGGEVLLIEQANFTASVFLHQHLMPALRQLADTRRRKANPILVILNFFWNAYYHVKPPSYV